MKKILIIGDIHANFPALKAVWNTVRSVRFDRIVNTGDLTVYSTFPNETIAWFRERKTPVISISGNTDRRMLNILSGKKLKNPKKKEKRVMYLWTAENLLPENIHYLRSLPKQRSFTSDRIHIGVFHGCYKDANRQLFPDTPERIFRQLAKTAPFHVHMMGHSHTPFFKCVNGVYFINPGSVGRMFDGDPRASFAVLRISSGDIAVEHFRIPYPVDDVVNGIKINRLPDIYTAMFRAGRKLN